jgi:hypothetical protein
LAQLVRFLAVRDRFAQHLGDFDMPQGTSSAVASSAVATASTDTADSRTNGPVVPGTCYYYHLPLGRDGATQIYHPRGVICAGSSRHPVSGVALDRIFVPKLVTNKLAGLQVVSLEISGLNEDGTSFPTFSVNLKVQGEEEEAA